MARWKHCLFPLLAALWVGLYWAQMTGAPRAARVVPEGVMVLILLFCVAIILSDAVLGLDDEAQEAADAETGLLGRPPGLLGFLRFHWREAAYVGLCVLYVVLFAYVGFHPANFIFLVLALWVSGNRPLTIVITATATTAVVFAVAHLMQFNMPTPILFR